MKNRIWAIVFTVLLSIVAYHIACATIKKYDIDNVKLHEFHMQYTAIK